MGELTAIRRHSYSKQTFPSTQNSQLLGFCTGAFAAAAVSSSRDVDELIPAGVHAAVVALHTGLYATEVAQSAGGANSAAPWSMIVQDASRNDVAQALERFNARKASTVPLVITNTTFAYLRCN